ITAAILGSFDSAVALSASGMPTGVTASFSPTSIAAPGSGSSTLTLTASSSAAAGTYTITAAVAGGFDSAIALSASGLPTGVTASFSPTSIAKPGSGSSTLTLTA